MLNTDPGAFSDQMPNTLVVGIFSLFSHNAVKTSPTRVRFSIVPDDNSGSDNYHKGVMMKVRNMVQGGAALAVASLLASLVAVPNAYASGAAPISGAGIGQVNESKVVASVEPMVASTVASVSPVGANGMSVLTLANGVRLNAPAPIADAARQQLSRHVSIRPADTVPGSCGSSYIYIAPNGNDSGVVVDTGYDVEPSVIGTVLFNYWDASGSNVTYNRSWGNQWSESSPGYDWENPYYQALKGAGFYIGGVSSGSYAYGTNAICYSESPTSRTDVP
jgi:hypothetical protein